jgi:hypothetical protein
VWRIKEAMTASGAIMGWLERMMMEGSLAKKGKPIKSSLALVVTGMDELAGGNAHVHALVFRDLPPVPAAIKTDGEQTSQL